MVLWQRSLQNAYIGEYYVVPTSIDLNKSGVRLTDAGQTIQLKAIISPSNARDTIIWTSSNTSIATVSNTWLVTCVTPWVCTITATTINWLTATCSTSPRLPSEYQEVEYIESSWTQFLATDVTYLTAPFRVEVQYMKQNTSTSDQTLVWQRQIWKYVNIYNNYYENIWSNSGSNTASWDSNIHTVVTDSSSWLYKDWTLLVSGTSWDRSSSYPLLIFAFTEDSYSNAKWKASVRIYGIKIISNWVLYRQYVPCYKITWSATDRGMYEIISRSFLTNLWTWTFTKWSDV